eukprot:scaffold25563_cov127-Cylindrotheca_fusiformis.AAC.1
MLRNEPLHFFDDRNDCPAVFNTVLQFGIKPSRAQGKKKRENRNLSEEIVRLEAGQRMNMSHQTQQCVAPSDSPPIISVDKVLAAELEKLSLKEREKVYEDVHGVSDVIQETPELVASCLDQMDREIYSIKKKDAYEQAKLQSYNLVTNRLFRLSFLRCSLFNPKMAAQRLVQYFTNKLEMFGAEKLGKSRINLEDIGTTATRILELGSMQVLPTRDSKGRAVVVSTPSFLEPAMAVYDDTISRLTMAFWYLMSTLSEDEESQKKGCVFVLNSTGLSERYRRFHRETPSRILAIAQYLPIRLACLHYCYDSSNSFPSIVLSELASAAQSIVRVRIRTHKGSHTECLYKLMSFGIPVEEYPFRERGIVELANHLKWLDRRRKKEIYLNRNPPLQGAVDLPSKHDVLLGRGKQIFRHPGNRLLHELVETYDEQYNQLSKDDKTKLADQIVAVVHGYSGHFMKLDNESGMWVEVSKIEAREKVTHRFRRNRAVGLNSREPIVAMKMKHTDGGGKRSRMMFNGS